MKHIQVNGGSVPGTDHTKPGQPGWINNQDAFTWQRTDQCLAAIVCDGCGSGSKSEVGANIGAQILIQNIVEQAQRFVNQSPEEPLTDVFWERVAMQVLGQISVLAKSMGPSLSQTVDNYFLFTFVGTLLTPTMAYVFSCGDGVYIVNDEVSIIGPFPGNAPPYLVYRLVGSSLQAVDPDLLKIQVQKTIPIAELNTMLLGTDGVADFLAADFFSGVGQPSSEEKTKPFVGVVSQFWSEDRMFTNADMIRRRMAMLNQDRVEGNKIKAGPLRDDTTLVVLRNTAFKAKEKVPPVDVPSAVTSTTKAAT